MPSPAIRVTIALLALSVSACTYPGQPGDGPAAVPVQGIRMTPQVIQFTAVGETRQLTATIFPANANDRAITWESTDTSVASVDAGGRVSAKAAGSGVFITAVTHDGQHEASANVSVNP